MRESTISSSAMSLAGQVLRRNISMDEGLVRSQTGHVLEAFIDSLNVLSGGKNFNLEAARQRLRSGEAEKALEGKIPCWEIPNEITEWTPEKVLDDAIDLDQTFETMAKDIEGLKQQRAEIQGLLFFLERVEKTTRALPNPWMGSVLVLVIAILLSGLVLLIYPRIWAFCLTLLSGIVVSFMVLKREYQWYSRIQEIERNHSEHRRKNMILHQKQIEKINQEISDIQSSAKKMIQALGDPEQEKVQLLISLHPQVFE